MFSLLYGFWQKMFERVEYRVLILGIDKVKEYFPRTPQWRSRVIRSFLSSSSYSYSSFFWLGLLLFSTTQVGKTTLLERIKVHYKLIASIRPSSILPTVGLNSTFHLPLLLPALLSYQHC